MNSSRMALMLCASVSTLCLAAQANAQTAAAPGASPQAVGEIVVTGSRIIRNGVAAPTPVTVATTEQLAATTPSNISDGLNKLPSFTGSRTQTTYGNGSAPGTGNYLNLRAFGVNRTLILLDGRRVPSTSFDGTVDTNVLPQMLVQRVDVVTGGASAVYGSDAVTGVVNYVLDHNFTGLKAVAQGGVSSRHDDASWKVGVAGGMPVGDRGHLIWSAEHYRSDGIPAKADRPYGSTIYQEAGLGTAASPFHTIANGRLASTSFGGLIVQPAGVTLPASLKGFQFLPGGVLAPFNLGTPSGNTGLSSGGDGGYEDARLGTLASPLTTNQLFARFQYGITDSTTFYLQANAADARNLVHSTNEARPYPGANAINIYSGNPFLPASVQSIMTANSVPFFGLARYNGEFGSEILENAYNTSFAVTGGLQGDFKGWKWETYYTHGEGAVRLASQNNINNQRFYAAADAVVDPASGATVCRVTLTNPGLYPGCVPMNLLGAGSPSAASIKYIEGQTEFQAISKMDDTAGNISGTPFSTWAGPVSVAGGFEYRTQTLDRQTSDDPNTLFNSTGLRGPFTTGTQPWTRNVVAASKGSLSVWEVNGETVVPILTGAPLAKLLEFNGAVRYTNYSTSGAVNTWKVGVNYEPFDDLRIRFTRSQDIRAPTLYDLYAGKALGISGFTDLHTGVAGFTNASNQGNPNLVPEVAETITVGGVFTPSRFPGLSMSLDYYSININNAIGSVGGNSASALTECENSGGTSPLCSLYIRPFPFSNRTAANYPTQINTQNLNVAQTSTWGLDLEIGYRFNLDQFKLPGTLDTRLLGAYQPVLYSRAFNGAQLLNAAGAAGGGPGAAAPQKERVTLDFNYRLEGLSVDTKVRYLSSEHLNSNPTLVFSDPDIPSIYYVDLGVSYDFTRGGHKYTAFLSVDNLFDQQPPLLASTAFTGNPGFYYPVASGYDVIGRYFTTGVRFRF